MALHIGGTRQHEHLDGYSSSFISFGVK
jgi:hypothetical protein